MAVWRDGLAAVLDWFNQILWEWPCMLVLFLAAGLYFSWRTGWFQFRRFSWWIKCTWGALFQKAESKNAAGIGDFAGERAAQADAQPAAAGISERQSICTALAATVGTGNIVGVATAIVAGGPGAVFWMWVSAFLGMMTGFAEKVLGILYRHTDGEGRYQGGPMTYMEEGLHAKWLALLFAVLCMAASFGIGNVAQIHSMSGSLKEAFGIPAWATGVAAALVVAVVLLGGIRRIGAFTEKLVPFMVLLYMGSALVVLACRAGQIPAALALIVREAFRLRPALGGAAGYGIAAAMRVGVARGVFTNEAGLGASVFAHSAANTKEPVQQGMWGIFEVFADTIVVCTVTALVILTTGLAQPETLAGLDGAALTMRCFTEVFPWGDQLIAVSLALFAFGSLIGWSYYGERATEYLFGEGAVLLYKMAYVFVVSLGSVASLSVVWKMADVCNGLMAIPNLAALFLLRRQVTAALKDYEGRFWKN